MGISGFKIVGRGDSIWYQESETKVYRELVDLIVNGQISEYKQRLESLKTNSENCVLNHELPILRQFYCEQKRCYYQPIFHTPYKHPVSWQAWTKARLMYWRVE
jgi:collagenase-like PrtC family protease